jgi:hypothetical protein
MFSNFRLATQVSLAIASITLISCVLIPEGNAQPIESATKVEKPDSDIKVEKSAIQGSRGYIGIGGAIGLSGETTSLSTGGFSILTKTVFSENISLHNSAIFGSGIYSSTSALTFNLPIRNDAQEIIITPFVGGGVLLRNEDGFRVSPHVTGGIDLPFARNLTGTARLNVGFVSDRPADIGLVLGIGYSFF